ncbi:hypothetical protein TNCV_412521 [Trichonephila clavipes]|uniref:Uncharacterized protein n=1 Tax=Trichonephila clavipes TaxID=2585209 RepID=A0A8X6V6C3_TRICX|nr:hypothetical protein TNCV_412521 [Trichonephila clavipes]
MGHWRAVFLGDSQFLIITLCSSHNSNLEKMGKVKQKIYEPSELIGLLPSNGSLDIAISLSTKEWASRQSTAATSHSLLVEWRADSLFQLSPET